MKGIILGLFDSPEGIAFDGSWCAGILWMTSWFILGMPHGGTDALKLWGLSQKRASTRLRTVLWFGAFSLAYFSASLLMGLMWHFVPLASILLFLALTIYHWGLTEGEIESSSPVFSARAGGFCRVGWIVSLSIGFDFEAATGLLEGASVFSGSSTDAPALLQPAFLLSGLFALAADALLTLQRASLRRGLSGLAWLALCLSMPASLTLAVFFMIGHSLRWLERECVKTNSSFREMHFKGLVVSAVLLIPWLAMLAFKSNGDLNASSATSAYLLLLSLLTLPHVLMEEGFRRRQASLASVLRNRKTGTRTE